MLDFKTRLTQAARLIALWSICPIFLADAMTVKGKVYDLDAKNPEQVLFHFERKDKSENSKQIVESTFKDLEGKIALYEKVTYKAEDPGHFENYTFDRTQSQEKGEIEVAGKEIKFTYQKGDSKKQRTEDNVPNLIIRDTLVQFVRNNWETLLKGDSVPARFAMPDRAETIGFKVSKIAETEIAGKKLIKMKLRPSSFIIGLVAGDTFFYLEPQSPHRIILVEGRMPILKNENGKLKNIRGRIEFSYEGPLVIPGEKNPSPTPSPSAELDLSALKLRMRQEVRGSLGPSSRTFFPTI